MTQECRQVEILRPAVKELIRVEQTSRVPELLRRAFAVATSGRPGPVLLDVPEDVCHGEHDFAAEDFAIDPTTLRVPARRIRPDRADIARAARADRRAPSGRSSWSAAASISRQGYDALLALAEAQSIPVAHTMSGKGGIACTHPLSVGLFGRYSRIANELIEASDCLSSSAASSARSPPSAMRCRRARSRSSISRSSPRRSAAACPAEVALWGDARAGLEDLAEALADDARRARAGPRRLCRRDPARMAAWRGGGRAAAQFARAADPHGAALPRAEPRLAGRQHPRRRWRVCRALDRAPLRHEEGRAAFHPRPRLGLDRLWAARRHRGGAGSAGDARSSRSTGDGGFNMMLGELETARRAGLGLTIVVVNNAASGYVKALQHAMFRGRYQSSDLVEMDYAAIARAMGCNGIRVEDPEQLGRRAGTRAGRAHPPDGARCHRHARPRPHAPRGRQPHPRNQARRPRRVIELRRKRLAQLVDCDRRPRPQPDAAGARPGAVLLNGEIHDCRWSDEQV